MAPELRIEMRLRASFRKKTFQEWVFLVGKTFPHPVGVFCALLGIPSGHIGSILGGLGSRVWGLGFGPCFPIGPGAGWAPWALGGSCEIWQVHEYQALITGFLRRMDDHVEQGVAEVRYTRGLPNSPSPCTSTPTLLFKKALTLEEGTLTFLFCFFGFLDFPSKYDLYPIK